MDNRFKNIDNELKFEASEAQVKDFFNDIDAYQLDNAFVEAAQSTKYAYSSAFWNDFTEQEPLIQQDVTYKEAAKNYNASYHPLYWTQVEETLVNEGLHYQYKSSYWEEAEKLLAEADRKVFFKKWMFAVAGLIIIGIVGNTLFNTSGKNSGQFLHQNNVAAHGNKISYTQQSKLDISVYKPSHSLVSTTAKNSVPTNSAITTPGNILGNNRQQNDHKDHSEIKNNKITSLPSNSRALLPTVLTPIHTESTQEVLQEAIVTTRVSQKIPDLNPDDVSEPDNNIRRLNISPAILVSQNLHPPIPQYISGIKLENRQGKKHTQLIAVAQSGIGSTFTNSTGINYRVAFDLGLEFKIKRIEKFDFSFLTGFDYQNLNNYSNETTEPTYFDSGYIGRVWYAYEFDNIIMWQSSFLIGYRLAKKVNLKFGMAYDRYLTSRIKVHESPSVDTYRRTPFQWGRNDFFYNNDIQILSRIEYQLTPNLYALGSIEFGLMNKLNGFSKESFISSTKNRSILFGIKYNLFN